MRQSKRWWITVAGVMCMGLLLFAQTEMYDRARSLVGRVQDDLRRAADFSSRTAKDGGKERERFENAQRHLSDFDRELTKNKFDHGKLDQAIDDLKNVVEHNTLSIQDRDELTGDLRELRAMRAWHDR